MTFALLGMAKDLHIIMQKFNYLGECPDTAEECSIHSTSDRYDLTRFEVKYLNWFSFDEDHNDNDYFLLATRTDVIVSSATFLMAVCLAMTFNSP